MGPLILAKSLTKAWKPVESVEELEGGEEEDQRVSRQVIDKARPGRALTRIEIIKSKRLEAKRKKRAIAKLQEENDEAVVKKFGPVVEMIGDRFFLKRSHATWFILCYFMRRLLQAVVILAMYTFPVAQILGTLAINLFYLVMVVHFQPYAERMEQTYETINELACLYTIYFMMLFTNMYIGDAETRDLVGLTLIGLSCTNFLVNMLPVVLEMRMACRRKYYDYKRKNATVRKTNQDAIENLNIQIEVVSQSKRVSKVNESQKEEEKSKQESSLSESSYSSSSSEAEEANKSGLLLIDTTNKKRKTKRPKKKKKKK